MFDGLFEDIGGKIKKLAKGIFIVEIIGTIITGFVLSGRHNALLGLLIMILGPIVAWVGSWFLYAFGELVEDVHAMRNREIPTVVNTTASAAGGWTCTCGRKHASYETSCVCGTTKAEARKKQ